MLERFFSPLPNFNAPFLLVLLLTASAALADTDGNIPQIAEAEGQLSAGASAGLRVYVDPLTGEFTAPQAGEKKPQGSRSGTRRPTSAARLVERSHPDKRIRGVVEVPFELYPQLTEKSVRGEPEIGCD